MGIIWFIVILGGIVLVHEFGHFIFSKMFGVYVYEFSIGMGPKLLHYKKKGGETEYCLRLIPIGGFVSLAGEDADDNSKIPKERMLYSKPVWQRFLIMIAGVMNNFITAFVLLFLIGLIWGSVSTKPIIANVNPEYPAFAAGIEKGDTILKIDNHKISSWSEVQLYIGISEGKEMIFTLKDTNNKIREVKVTPETITNEEGNKSYVVGISLDNTVKHGFTNALSYAGNTTIGLCRRSIGKRLIRTSRYLYRSGLSSKTRNPKYNISNSLFINECRSNKSITIPSI